jgi:hypothetical protein
MLIDFVRESLPSNVDFLVEYLFADAPSSRNENYPSDLAVLSPVLPILMSLFVQGDSKKFRALGLNPD